MGHKKKKAVITAPATAMPAAPAVPVPAMPTVPAVPTVPTAPAKSTLPFVSICTPTFNRRPFIPYMIKCFEHQDYPKDRMEWIIIDDGTDKIGDLVKDIPQVKYFSYNEKMLLGKKRNLMHSKTTGDIIVYMDDDDYYPPTRVSHAVDVLQKNPKALCAGSSEIYIYFKHVKKMYQFGPYGPMHSTAGTFAFKKRLLSMSKYDDKAALAEEKHFLKNYTIPFVQLDTMKTILVFSHDHNTFDKRRLLNEHFNEQFTKESGKTVEQFIENEDIRDFYMNRIEELLKSYEQGRSYMKPDVIKQMVEMEKERKAEIEKHQKQQQQYPAPTITLKQGDGPSQQLTMDQVVSILQQQQAQIIHLTNLLQGKDEEIKLLNTALSKNV
jgi:glycosyltransferase involved in cell wall biosynthesis